MNGKQTCPSLQREMLSLILKVVHFWRAWKSQSMKVSQWYSIHKTDRNTKETPRRCSQNPIIFFIDIEILFLSTSFFLLTNYFTLLSKLCFFSALNFLEWWWLLEQETKISIHNSHKNRILKLQSTYVCMWHCIACIQYYMYSKHKMSNKLPHFLNDVKIISVWMVLMYRLI